jgi:3-oxoacyl-[acyl-carrier protein] reductase
MRTLGGHLRRFLEAVAAAGSRLYSRPEMEGKTFATDALAERLVLITGASRGIGAAIARLAAAVGADVAVAYYEQHEGAEATATAVRALGRRAEIFEADLADPVAARAMVGSVVERMGTIDGLVNNAGIMPQAPFLEISDAEWSHVIGTDLTAAFACSQAVLPGMLDRGKGSIVMISSRLGQIGFAGVAHYAAAKAGVIALAKSIAREYGQHGIRANAVAPGVVVTDMTSADVITGEVGQRRLAELPLGRFGRPDEIAAAVVFLLSDASSLFLGQTLGANSGGFMP